MKGMVTFSYNQASEAAIMGHLQACEAGFTPPLGLRVELSGYARKLSVHSDRFEAWVDGDLVGLVAAYLNDPARQAGFISSVSVLEAWQGMGIARRLLAMCMDRARMDGFSVLRLDVGAENEDAVRLYTAFGFAEEGRSGRFMRMCLQLRMGDI